VGYGIKVFNSSGRTIFNTDDDFPAYHAVSAPMTVMGYMPTISYNWGSEDILLARPPDNTSGAIFAHSGLSPDATQAFFGAGTAFFCNPTTTISANFGVAAGVKHITFSRQDAIPPSSSGYGIQIYKANGIDLVYTSNTAYSFNILSIGSLVGAQTQTFTCPAGVDFNNVYVIATSVSAYLGYNTTPIFDPAPPDYATTQYNYRYFGRLAHFNHATSVITLRQHKHWVFTTSPLSAGSFAWDTTPVSLWNGTQRQDYLIVEVKY
jgi:hypothetical protein